MSDRFDYRLTITAKGVTAEEWEQRFNSWMSCDGCHEQLFSKLRLEKLPSADEEDTWDEKAQEFLRLVFRGCRTPDERKRYDQLAIQLDTVL